MRLSGAWAAAVFTAALWGCGSGEAPKDLPGVYAADLPELGSYSRSVELRIGARGEAELRLCTAEGQPHSIREGRWETRHNKLVVEVYSRGLVGPPPAKGVEASPLAPDEVLVFRVEDGALKAVDYDRRRWAGADLTLRKGTGEP
jgi:hypothetical protein